MRVGGRFTHSSTHKLSAGAFVDTTSPPLGLGRFMISTQRGCDALVVGKLLVGGTGTLRGICARHQSVVHGTPCGLCTREPTCAHSIHSNIHTHAQRIRWVLVRSSTRNRKTCQPPRNFDVWAMPPTIGCYSPTHQ